MKILKRFGSEADQGLSSELDALGQDLEGLETSLNQPQACL